MIQYTTLEKLRPVSKEPCKHEKIWWNSYDRDNPRWCCNSGNRCGTVVPYAHDYVPDWCNDCDSLSSEHRGEDGDSWSTVDHGECHVCMQSSYHAIHHGWGRNPDDQQFTWSTY